MLQTPKPPSPTARFVGALTRLESQDRGSDRATMAALRAGLRTSNGVATEMMPFVAPFLPEREFPSDERFFQIAALFALHPQNSFSGSFASAFRELADGNSDSIEKRFQMLLACEGDQLFRQLQQCVSLLASKNIPVNWRKLLDDLVFNDWDDPNRELQLRWAREFYRKPAAPTDNDQPNPTQS